MSQYKSVSTIEMLGKAGECSNLEAWLEKETFFMDFKFVEKFTKLHKKWITKDHYFDKSLISVNTLDKSPEKNELFNSSNYQEIVDSQCIFNLCRETQNFQPFFFLSEKTIRCFYNHLIPLPVNGKTIIADLTELGFYMFEDLVDFSYLQEDLFPNKIASLEAEINRLAEMPCEYYQKYYNANLDKFQSNQKLVVNWGNTIKETLEKKISLLT
jgi:uncharacterized HAD superfamily protein